MSEKMYTLSDLKKMKQDYDSMKQQLEDLVKKWEAENEKKEKEILLHEYHKNRELVTSRWGEYRGVDKCIRELKAIIEQAQQ